ncbi:MAG: thiamine phosphate synthase [Candidatus Dormibacteria bacterium]
MSRNAAWRRQRLHDARLYVVTDARTCGDDLASFVDAVLRGGADIIQLRDKQAEAGDLLRWSETFRNAAERYAALFIVNDRPDVSLAAGADGVHLGQNDLPLAVAREILGGESIIGLSTHSIEQLSAAPPEADYLCAGPVYETPTKPGRRASGLELVRAATTRSESGLETRPWFAIGGIDEHTLPSVLDAGARRVAVVRAVAHGDIEARTRALKARLDEGL